MYSSVCEERCRLRSGPLSGFVSESSEGILRVLGFEIHLVSARNESELEGANLLQVWIPHSVTKRVSRHCLLTKNKASEKQGVLERERNE